MTTGTKHPDYESLEILARVLEEAENGVLLRSVEQAISQAQAIRRRYPDGGADSCVDAFLASRTSDSGL